MSCNVMNVASQRGDGLQASRRADTASQVYDVIVEC